MNQTVAITSIAVGVVAICAALWRIGTGLFRFVRRFDRFMTEHDQLLKASDLHSQAIIKLNRRLDRVAANRG